MRLLNRHPEGGEAEVIHIVYRELPPHVLTPAETTLHDSGLAEDERNFSPVLTNAFNDSLDCEGSISRSLSPPLRDQTRCTSPLPGSALADPMSPQLNLQITTPSPLGNYTGVSFTPEFFYPQEVIGAVEESIHNSRILSSHETLLLPNAAYPEYIHDTLAYVSDLPPSRKNYYSLWAYVLEYWFPPTEGFQVVEDWDPENALLARPKASLTVLDTVSPRASFLSVNIHNGMPVNDLSRMYAKTTLEEAFEMLRSCSFCAGFKTLCVISAVGARWNMVVRETGWLEGEANGCNDYVGQLEEDVTTSESYRVMGYCFEELKKSVVRRREERCTNL